jgi:ADP-ribosyl-[dinitrogen reductase] hydrolase
MTQPDRQSRLQGAIWGLLVGDALGVPYEFNHPDALPPAHEIEFDPPLGFARSHRGVPPGSWSDDGAQALCLLASLLHCGRLDPTDLMNRLTNWYEHGYMAVDGRVFDIGIQTSNSLAAYRRGVPALEAGGLSETANGNGSLMRVLPLALWHRGSDRDLVRDACLQSRVTHGHLRSQLCCALYCLWARGILGDSATPFADAVSALRSIITGDEAAEAELEFHIRPEAEVDVSGSGYVVDSLRSARWACELDSFETVLRRAVKLGRDTDTTACIAGGIAGLREGVEAIPERWRHGLRDQELFLPLIERLLETASSAIE